MQEATIGAIAGGVLGAFVTGFVGIFMVTEGLYTLPYAVGGGVVGGITGGFVGYYVAGRLSRWLGGR